MVRAALGLQYKTTSINHRPGKEYDFRGGCVPTSIQSQKNVLLKKDEIIASLHIPANYH